MTTGITPPTIERKHFETWQVGSVTVTRIPESVQPLPLTALFPTADAEVLVRDYPWLQPDYVDARGEGLFSVHFFALESEGHRLLVDTGNGNGKTRVLFSSANNLQTTYLDDLDAIGMAPDSIDYVVCTHLHGDHVGGSTTISDGVWVPAFPNAEYLWPVHEIEHWRRAAEHPTTEFEDEMVLVYNDSVAPIVEAGLVTDVPGRTEVIPGVWLEPTPGHSPGHLSVHIVSAGEEAWFPGDVVHHPLQMINPSWGYADHDSGAAEAARRTLFEHVADQDVRVFGSHWAGRNPVRISRDGEAYRVRD